MSELEAILKAGEAARRRARCVLPAWPPKRPGDIVYFSPSEMELEGSLVREERLSAALRVALEQAEGLAGLHSPDPYAVRAAIEDRVLAALKGEA